MPDDSRFDELIALVADGRAIDWAARLASCRDDEERNLLAQLKVLTDIAQVEPLSPDRDEPTLSRRPSARSAATSFQWGPLEVFHEIGRGASGRVFHARDPRLDRDVALKLFDRASGGEAKLVREAQLLARIRHPHVVAIHGADTIDGRSGLWMELVRGRTLHDVLRQQGTFGPREAALIGLDLCGALAAVHGAGLVHRDIKATNAMRETGGRIVLMDFGAGFQRDDGDGGVATGTPLYMAPELLGGAEASVSTDLYSLGVLLFHLVTGVYPVNGSSLAELRERHAGDARTLLRDARPDIPAALARVIDRALSPAPTARFRSAAEMERALAATLDVERVAPLGAPARSWWRRWVTSPARASIKWSAVPILCGAALFASWQLGRPPAASNDQSETAPREAIAFSVEPPGASRFAEGPGLLAVSPDGRRIAFATALDQVSSTVPTRLWVRRLESVEAEPIAGTETGNQPFWSPDARFLGFSTSDMSLKRVEVSSGSVVALAGWGLGGAWNSSGVVLFTGHDGRLYRVSEEGGAQAAVTSLNLDEGETQHLWPSFLPDGRRFVFLARRTPSESALYAGSIDAPARTRIGDISSKAEYAGGYLFYQREGRLMAHRFDLQTARLLGEAKPVATAVRFAAEGRSAFSVSSTGVVVYATDTGSAISSLTWFDATGKRLASVGGPGTYAYPTLSPDGGRLAVDRRGVDGHWDVWLTDLARDVSTRFTFNNQVGWGPLSWSPDGAYVVFTAQDHGRGAFNLYRRATSGTSGDEACFESADDKEPSGFSPDGSLLLFNRALGPGHGTDIWALPWGGDEGPFRVLGSAYDEESGVFSPDGRWMAYASNESGVFQVYAQPFPPTGTKVQISRDGGTWPRWTADGRILYSSAERLWSVDVRMTGGMLRAGLPKALFKQAYAGGRSGDFAVDRTGTRILLVVPEQAQPSRLNVLVNPLAR